MNEGRWVDRYADDETAPTVGEFARDVAVRALLPMLVLLAGNLGIGWAITRLGEGWRFEDALNAALQAGRTPTLDSVTRAASTLGNAPSNIIFCVLVMGLIAWRTRQWWLAATLGVALVCEAIVHAVTSTVIDRPRPEVAHLDAAQPTASFPSGHVGATLAQVLILLFLAHQLRWRIAQAALWVLGMGFVFLLAFSRLYLGMHHLSDVLVGVLNGVVCAALGWWYLRRRPPESEVEYE